MKIDIDVLDKMIEQKQAEIANLQWAKDLLVTAAGKDSKPKKNLPSNPSNVAGFVRKYVASLEPGTEFGMDDLNLVGKHRTAALAAIKVMIQRGEVTWVSRGLYRAPAAAKEAKG